MKSEQPLKIGFVLDGGIEKPDGVQQYITALGNYFNSKGHEVRYIVAGPIPGSINNAKSLASSIKVKSNGNELTIPLPTSSKKVRNYLDEEKFDVLHIQTPYSPLMGERTIFLSGKKTAIIGTFHIIPGSKLLSIGDWLLGKLCYFSLRKFDQMLSVSSAAQHIAKRDFGLDTIIVPNVVNYSKYNDVSIKKKVDSPKIILFLGRLVPRKGSLELLKSLKILVESHDKLPQFKLCLAGSGPLEPKLREFIKNNNLGSYVEFKGFIDEIEKPKIYASADISVFPSISGESFGIVLIEALSSGKSVVLAGNNVGYSSVLAPKPELLFNPKKHSELADLLFYYLTHEVERKELAKWGETYAKNFDVGVVGDKIIEIYRQNIDKKSKQIDN